MRMMDKIPFSQSDCNYELLVCQCLNKKLSKPDEMVNNYASMHEENTTNDAEGGEVIDNR